MVQASRTFHNAVTLLPPIHPIFTIGNVTHLHAIATKDLVIPAFALEHPADGSGPMELQIAVIELDGIGEPKAFFRFQRGATAAIAFRRDHKRAVTPY